VICSAPRCTLSYVCDAPDPMLILISASFSVPAFASASALTFDFDCIAIPTDVGCVCSMLFAAAVRIFSATSAISVVLFGLQLILLTFPLSPVLNLCLTFCHNC